MSTWPSSKVQYTMAGGRFPAPSMSIVTCCCSPSLEDEGYKGNSKNSLHDFQWMETPQTGPIKPGASKKKVRLKMSYHLVTCIFTVTNKDLRCVNTGASIFTRVRAAVVLQMTNI